MQYNSKYDKNIVDEKHRIISFKAALAAATSKSQYLYKEQLRAVV